MEVLLNRPHMVVPGAKQVIGLCDGRTMLGLSCVWASSRDSGLYTDGKTVEAYIIRLLDMTGENYEFIEDTDPYGYLNEDELDALVQCVREKGVEGYREFDRSGAHG